MSDASFNTRIIGYPEYVNLGSKKSSVISNEVVITDIEEIVSYAQTSMGVTTPNTNSVIANGDYDGGFNIYQEYYPFSIIKNITSAGTYEISPIRNCGIQIDVPSGNVTDISCNIKYSSFVWVSESNIVNFSMPLLENHYSDAAPLYFNYNFQLESIDFPLLSYSSTYIEVIYCPLFNTLNVPNLVEGGIELIGGTGDGTPTSYLTVNMGSLETASVLTFSFFFELITNFSSLKTIGSLRIDGVGAFGDNGVDFSNVTTIKNYIFINNSPNLFDLSFPNMVEYGDSINIDIQTNTSILLGTIGVLKKMNSPNLQLGFFTNAEIEPTLALFVSLDGTNGTTLSENGYLSVGIETPISTQVQAYVDTLISRGWNVIIND